MDYLRGVDNGSIDFSAHVADCYGSLLFTNTLKIPNRLWLRSFCSA